MVVRGVFGHPDRGYANFQEGLPSAHSGGYFAGLGRKMPRVDYGVGVLGASPERVKEGPTSETETEADVPARWLLYTTRGRGYIQDSTAEAR